MTTRIPAHLPRRLAICYYGWDWITAALPGEAYGDLERAVRETKERGFNCIRPDLGLGMLYDASGHPRGKLGFRARLPGANANLQCVDARGGGVHDVRERVMRLFALADQYDLYVIGTSWLYQDFLTDIADDGVREELIRIPHNERLMMLARQWDWLLTELDARGLAHRMAMVELLNEIESTPCSTAAAHTPTFSEWEHGASPNAPAEQLRELAYRAVAYLRERHPAQLMTVDLGNARHCSELLPENAQVVDHHVYSESVTLDIMAAAGLPAWSNEATAPVLEGNDLLRALLKPEVMSWQALCDRARGTRNVWRSFAWFYQNLDNAKYDAWCVEHFDARRVRESVEHAFRVAAAFAHPRGLPLVVDEGYLVYPPLHSRFVTTPEGRWGEEIAVEAAISTGHWGIIPTGYFRPNTPVWHDDAQCAWIRGVNAKIMTS